MRVLVTGGAGFIGSHIVDLLVERGDDVLSVDNLSPAAHAGPPSYLNPGAEYRTLSLDDIDGLTRPAGASTRSATRPPGWGSG